MNDELIKITQADLDNTQRASAGANSQPDIVITADELGGSPEAQTGLARPITIQVDGESVEVEASVVVTWKDIIESEAHNAARVDIDMPLSDAVPENFHHAIRSNLANDIGSLRGEGKTNRQIYRELITRYHPDLYRDASPEAQQLVTQYTQALQALRERGELKD